MEELKVVTNQEIRSYLEKAIEEFDELFGDYISKEEVIRRINEKVKEIKFEDNMVKDKNAMGMWSSANGTICIDSRLDKIRIEGTIFHEMLHAIRTDEDRNIGFKRKYVVGNIKDRMYIYVGTALEEGFVQYLANIRNKKFANSIIKIYTTEQNLLELFELDEEKMISVGLKNPEKIVDEIALATRHSNNHEDTILVENLLIALDDRLRIRRKKEEDVNIKNDCIEIAKDSYIYLKGDVIQSSEELNNALINLNHLLIEFGNGFGMTARESQIKLEDVYELMEEIPEEYIDGAIKGFETRGYIYLKEKLETAREIKKFKVAEIDEKMKMLQEGSRLAKCIYGEQFAPKRLNEREARLIMINIKSELGKYNGEEKMLKLLCGGIAEEILKNGYKLGNIEISEIGENIYKLKNYSEDGEVSSHVFIRKEERHRGKYLKKLESSHETIEFSDRNIIIGKNDKIYGQDGEYYVEHENGRKTLINGNIVTENLVETKYLEQRKRNIETRITPSKIEELMNLLMEEGRINKTMSELVEIKKEKEISDGRDERK